VGIIGLGVGTLATYAQPGQYYRFYEINDNVERFADKYFSYLADCRGTCDVVLGDGRLSLEREQPQRFDVLVLDAFSGDAVPTHLLTKEAFEIYRKHLRPGATVAVNISNRYLDLSPVVAGLADHFGYRLRRVQSPGDAALGQFPADWIVLTPPSKTAHVQTAAAPPARKILWTDDHSNLFEILK
jgi:spermidine synthase